MLQFIVGAVAVVTAGTGIGVGASGVKKVRYAKAHINEIHDRHESNCNRMDMRTKMTNESMDSLALMELKVLDEFKDFSDLVEKIHNRPEFEEIVKDKNVVSGFNIEEIKKVSVGANLLISGLAGAATGTAAGFAASGAVTSAIMVLGTASTGTAISSLSGAAAVNATLAALGGGSLAAGGGGIALGTTILNLASVGTFILVGGIVINATGRKLSQKAEEAYLQMLEEEEKINKICTYLTELGAVADKYNTVLKKVYKRYVELLNNMDMVICEKGKTDWNDFTNNEKNMFNALVLLVGVLYNMCSLELVKKNDDENGMNTINKQELFDNIKNADNHIKI